MYILYNLDFNHHIISRIFIMGCNTFFLNRKLQRSTSIIHHVQYFILKHIFFTLFEIVLLMLQYMLSIFQH